jgi:hypothetical protein
MALALDATALVSPGRFAERRYGISGRGCNARMTITYLPVKTIRRLILTRTGGVLQD